MFKIHYELLAKSLADYTDYLLEKNKHMKGQHALNAPSHQIEANLSMSFIPVSVSQPSQLETIKQALATSSELDIIDLSSFSPTGKNTSIFSLKDYVSQLTYSAGSSVGNIVAVFRLPHKGEQLSVCLLEI